MKRNLSQAKCFILKTPVYIKDILVTWKHKKPEIKWEKDGVEIETSDRVRIMNQQKKLFIRNVDSESGRFWNWCFEISFWLADFPEAIFQTIWLAKSDQ